MKNSINLKMKKNPSVALVACLHGDEIIGKKVIEKLRNVKLKRGALTCIIAHPRAVQKKKRFLQQDLNRSFPGKAHGALEEKIARELHYVLREFDFVIDVHGTNSDIRSLAIIANLTAGTRGLLKATPIKQVALIKKEAFGGKELIAHCKAGISLEYGPDKSGKNYPIALKHVKSILTNLGMLSGKQTINNNKELFTVNKSYRVSKDFKQARELKDFKKITEGQVVGTDSSGRIRSSQTFYPIFLGKGRYQGMLALVAKKTNIIL